MSRKGSAEEMHRAPNPTPFFLLCFLLLFLFLFVFNKRTAYIPIIAYGKMMWIGFADMFYCLLCGCALGKMVLCLRHIGGIKC